MVLESEMRQASKLSQLSLGLDPGNEGIDGEFGGVRARERALMHAVQASDAVSFVHAGFAMTNLPYRRIQGAEWVRRNGPMTLRVDAGKDETGQTLGVPFGSLARIVLYYLQTEVIRTQRRTVSLGQSMYAWMNQVNISRGGRTVKALIEQTKLISTCRLTFYYLDESKKITRNGAFIRTSFFSPETNWGQVVEIDEAFFEALLKHPLPVRESAIQFLADRSLALDVYVWICYKLNRLDTPVFISWRALYVQFGVQHGADDGSIVLPSRGSMSSFKIRFIEALKRATHVYPAANVSINEKGMSLLPSPPAVPPREQILVGRA